MRMNLYIIILASPTKALQGAALAKHTKYIKIFNKWSSGNRFFSTKPSLGRKNANYGPFW